MPLIVCFLIKKSADPEAHYVVSRGELSASVSKYLPTQLAKNYVESCIGTLLRSKLVREEAGYLIPQPRLGAAWSMFKRSSVYLELFRDDTFLGRDQLRLGGEIIATNNLNPEDMFMSVMALCEQVRKAEDDVVSEVRKKPSVLDEYKNDVGHNTFSSYMWEAIKNSINAYYKQNDPNETYDIPENVADEMASLKSRVERLNQNLKLPRRNNI